MFSLLSNPYVWLIGVIAFAYVYRSRIAQVASTVQAARIPTTTATSVTTGLPGASTTTTVTAPSAPVPSPNIVDDLVKLGSDTLGIAYAKAKMIEAQHASLTAMMTAVSAQIHAAVSAPFSAPAAVPPAPAPPVAPTPAPPPVIPTTTP